MRFTLVHGGSHGAWCWEKLIRALKALGHDAVAMDLPGHGKRRGEVSEITGYRDAVLEVLRPGDVLVGHSMGCPVATMAADAQPTISHIVYLSGPLPVEGKPMGFEGAVQRCEDGTAKTTSKFKQRGDSHYRVSDDGQFFLTDFEPAVRCFFHDCDPETAKWAFDHLTPQRIDVVTSQSISVPRFWQADLPRSFVLCTEDRVFPAQWSALTAKRLGVRPLEIASSHSPFLSRPAELARMLVRAVDTRPIGPLVPNVRSTA